MNCDPLSEPCPVSLQNPVEQSAILMIRMTVTCRFFRRPTSFASTSWITHYFLKDSQDKRQFVERHLKHAKYPAIMLSFQLDYVWNALAINY